MVLKLSNTIQHNTGLMLGHLSTLCKQANCIDSTAAPEAVFASEVKKMTAENMKPQEQLTLEPYERDHAVVVGIYRCVSYWV